MHPERRPADAEISVDDFAGPPSGPRGVGRPSEAAPRRRSPEPAPPTSRFRAAVGAWAAGRNGWVRAPLLLWLGWILLRLWSDPGAPTIFAGIDLAIHEIGHILWSPFGEFMGFAGGSLTQVMAPVAAGAVLYRQNDWFGVAFAAAWLGINCFEIAAYAGDALTRQLPLVSPGTGEPEHDWTWMLATLDLLPRTEAVAAAWLWAGRLSMIGGIGFGAWVLRLMARRPGPS